MTQPASHPVGHELDMTISDVEDNNETCFAKTWGLITSLTQVLVQVSANSLGDFLHNEKMMYADQRVSRIKERLSYSAEPISQTSSVLKRYLDIPHDSTMNEFDLDRAFVDIYSKLHPKLKTALHYLIWRQAGSPHVAPDLFGKDLIEANPRSEHVRMAINYLSGQAEYHREYLPQHIVLYSDDPELEQIVLEGIYNITLSVSSQ